jgi:TonB-linked SusC/RagA family outer membrane protein
LSKITTPKATSIYTKQAMMSYFGRVNYKFDEKYLVTASLRADGSSTLAPKHKWGYFPSVGAAWRVSEESFLTDVNAISNLKLRASWGISGNAAVDPYSTLKSLSDYQVYYYLGGKNVPGNIPSKMGNLELTWEKTAAYNFGLDFGVLDNRISGSVDYFISNTSDLLCYMSTPPSSVYPSIISNIGKTKGQGIEVALNTLIIKSKDFNWDVNWSYSHFKDEVTYLSDGVTRNLTGNDIYMVGEPVKAFFDYESNGCWNVGEFAQYKLDWAARNPDKKIGYVSGYGDVGTIKIIDLNDDGKLDDSDKRIYDRTPKHILGMNNTFTYKDFSLSVLVYARLGGYIEYGMNSQLNYESANWGDLDYWTLNNLDAKFPNPGAASSTFATYGSALTYEKADYIKIKDITLSYSLPQNFIRKAGIERVKFYGSLKNFFTFSSIDNYDPERGGSINFPLAKQLVFGVNVQF